VGLRYRVEGRENIPAGNAIILAKHQSTWETLAMQQVFPPQVWLLKRELLKIPFFGWGLALLEPIAIDRNAGRKALKQLAEIGKDRLGQGLWVVVFPEGTRTAFGDKGQYQVGGAYLAEKSGYPVVPVAHDAGRFWPRHSFLKYPGEIRMVIGKPIESRGRKAGEINREVEEWIEARMAEFAATEGEVAANNAKEANSHE
jgi:1-acyl-sn-glycerol-3-phosphate acyltransferase